LSIPLQAVPDEPTDQNFRQLGERFPIQRGDLGKGAVGQDQLGTAAKELFLQLAAAGVRKIAFGVGSMSFSASSSASKTITHGLGTTPTVVLVTGKTGSFQMLFNADTYGSTTFRAWGYWTPGSTVTTTQEFAWIAIG
jgi:hypothetical protein